MSPEQPSSKIGKSVGERLRAARIALHYTQSQLAAPDFSVSYISAIERGQIHPSLRALEILAARLGLSSTQLLPGRGQAEDRQSAQVGQPERDDDEMEMALLEAEVAIRQHEPSQALTQLGKLSTKRLKRQQQLRCRYLLGWAYLETSQFQECEYTLSDALQLAKDLNADYLTLRILNLQATAYTAMRNYSQALLNYQRCLHMLENAAANDPLFNAEVYMHMGQYYSYVDNLESSIEMFHKALVTLADYSTLRDIQSRYLFLSQYYSELKEYDLAARYAYDGLYLADLATVRQLRSEIYHYLGHAVMQGEQEQAKEFLDEAISKESVPHDLPTLASLYTRKAEWHFLQREFAEAADYARQAQELVGPMGDSLIGAEIYIVLGRISYAQEHYDQGDSYFRDGLQMLERLGRHEELADESVKYAQLLEEHGKAREAFQFFRRAFESRQLLGR